MKYILLIGSLKKRITIHLDWRIKSPIMFTDSTGMIGEEIIIKGKKKQEAFAQLQASTKLNLTMDVNGKVGIDDTKAKSKSDKKLLEAINSTTVQVNVNATDSNYTSSGRWIVGGSCEGSEVDESGIVQTMQTVNPSQKAHNDAMSLDKI